MKAVNVLRKGVQEMTFHTTGFNPHLLLFLNSSADLLLLSDTFTVTMSFGYSVGDCIAILQLANKVLERFDDAPEQFQAISNE